jgi:P pilus assembly protein, pilin FimA
MKRINFNLSCLLVLLFISVNAYAGCTANSASAPTIVPPNLTVQRDTPVGTMIGAQVMSGVDTPFTCVNDNPPITNQDLGIRSSGTFVTTIGGRRIYSTSLPGVGYSLGIVSVNNCGGTSGWIDGTLAFPGNINSRLICRNLAGMLANQPPTVQTMIQYYKTGDITSGTVNAQGLGAYLTRINGSIFTEVAVNTASFSVTALACTVTNPSIVVNMGTVVSRNFSGVGSSPSDGTTKNFDINLSCNPGTSVNLQIDGDAWSAPLGVLNNGTGTGFASGVGIQLLTSANSPFALGTPTAITNSASSNQSIPLLAQYYQTDSTIAPGTVNITATFTLTYQ